MTGKYRRGLFALYAKDAERADALVFGRRTDSSRRGFLKNAGLASMTSLLGGAMPFARFFPAGLVPAAFAESDAPFEIAGKQGLTLLNDKPLSAQTPPHLLADLITPTHRHFIRNNGVPPKDIDPRGWRLTVSGAVERELTFSIDDLKRDFEIRELALQLECGGNGRASFNPPVSGNQWSLGAIANAQWRGVRLADVLRRAGVQPSAVYTGHSGADTHLSGALDKQPLSRGVPIDKAMDPNNLIAFEQNGAAIHPQNGAPLRLVIPGWPGSCSQKWLTNIHVSETKWTGAKMLPPAYSVPTYAALPGAAVNKKDFRTIESMPVKSMITTPVNAFRHADLDASLMIAGHAWAGDLSVARVDVSIDFGASWLRATVDAPLNPYSWQAWRAPVRFPTSGYFEVWARATDTLGNTQPFAVRWNPKGYLNNAMHRIAVLAGAT
ncbi:MAG: sulfite oxidase [Pseudomonadota bacterium]